MTNLIELLQHQHLVWQGSAQVAPKATTTGFTELDEHLAGGFHTTGVTEIQSESGVGELRLLMPVLAEAKVQQRLIVFIAPQGLISAQALAAQGIELDKVLTIYPKDQQQALWTAEQCLRSGACHSVLMWSYQALEIHHVKRLQVASETGNCRQFILREGKAESLSLPFDLSLSLQTHAKGVTVKINKRKCGWPSEAFHINMVDRWPSLTQQALPDNLIPFPQVQTG
ncbi:translesion DNA synthesis-associated protein ImuA [Shewanella maritima]|uniref:Translesion DNA synthesis-associated protein ImuA n=1 Tax=Shewanella maritima TaxID=2520507 RepID=A0A411PJ32_9GAMM|nr:translesion DNA synthesis-associated protein ImuA [Shewanella maritima]QBF83553.1 translesion DNA synthesis-associated protein ImuA [Shewanella maritima]